MTLDDVGDAIVARLRAHLPHARCDHFPDAPDRYETLLAAPDTVLVSFKGGTDSAPLSLAPVHTEETIEWWVVLTCRSMRGPSGIAARTAEIRKALVGWRPPCGGTPMVPRSRELVDEMQGIWRYRMRFAHTVPRVAVMTPLTGTPLTLKPTIEEGTP